MLLSFYIPTVVHRLQNVKVLNSPARTYSVSNPAPLVMTGLTIDNCGFSSSKSMMELTQNIIVALGDLPNSKSNGIAAGHNTDGFDASTTDLTIQNRYD